MIYLSLSDWTIIRKGMPMKKEICRINNGKMAKGVCGGIAIWLYLICTLAMPKEEN